MEEMNTLEMKDAISLRGVFTMNVYKGEGVNRKLIEAFEDHNLIVNLARVSMAHLIAGDVDDRSMLDIAFGTNGNPPTVDDTEITDPFVKELGGITYPQAGQVRFAWNLTNSEANGMAIMEFGLLTADGNLFCRRTRTTPINKESDISLEGTWTIIF
jgi:hypothetical protein